MSKLLVVAALAGSLAAAPLSFEANQGQSAPQVKLLARAPGYMAFLTARGAVLRFKGADGAVLAMQFPHANPAPRIIPEDRQTAVSNYFLAGSAPILAVPHYAAARYAGLYPGIDLVYSGSDSQLEYTFQLHPGADPAQIRIAFSGAHALTINAQGDLELQTAAGAVINRKPVVYQLHDGVRRYITGGYAMLASHQIGFHLGSYDHTLPLVIDPVVSVMAFLGGSLNDEAYGVAVSPFNSGTVSGVLLTGRTESTNFPVTSPVLQSSHSPNSPVNYDVFVTKISPDGTELVWSTYIGGTGDDAGRGIAVDKSGNIYVTGYTNPQPTPLSGNVLGAVTVTPVVALQGSYDAFIFKLAPTGQSILAATFYGGPNPDQAFAIALDSSASATAPNVIIAGLTGGGIAPVSPDGAQAVFANSANPVAATTDGFVARFDSNLNLLHATYLGGSGNDQVNGIAVDSSGDVYAAGSTSAGTAFPVANNPAQTLAVTGSSAAFLVKLNPALNLEIYGTLFGQGGSGSDPDTANAVAVDAAGRAYVVGSTGDIGLTIFNTPALNSGSALTAAGQSQGYLAIFNNYTGGTLSLASLWLQVPASPALILPPQPDTVAGVTGENIFNGGAWNSVAVDANQDAYAAGQFNIGPTASLGQLYAQFVRFNPAGIPITNPFSTIPIFGTNAGSPATVATAVAVNPQNDTTYLAGWTTATALAPTPANGLGFTSSTGGIYGNTNMNSGGADALFVTLTNNDIVASPAALSFTSSIVPPGSAPAAQSINVVAPLACTSAPTATVTPAGNFTATPFSNVASNGNYVFSIAPTTAALGNPGTVTANVIFTSNSGCTFDNSGASVALSLNVGGTVSLVPQYSLTGLTSLQGSGVIQPFFQQGVQAAPFQSINDPITVITPTGTLSGFTPSIGSTSTNWPTNCALLSPSAGTLTSFTVTLNATCAGTLAAGAYSAEILLTSPTVAANSSCPNSAAACLPFSLTVQASCLDCNQTLSIVFGASTASEQLEIPVSAPSTGGTFSYSATYPATNNLPSVGSLLPASAVSFVSATSGSLPAGGEALVQISINPAGLASGVYSGEFLVSGCSSTGGSCTPTPQTYIPLTIYVGTGLALEAPVNLPGSDTLPISGAGGAININVPFGFTSASLPNPYTVTVTGLDGSESQPYVLNPPTISTTPALPGGAVTLSPASGTCTTYGSTLPIPLSPLGATCSYNLTISASLLTPATTYKGTITFPVASGPSTTGLVVPFTINAQPSLGLYLSQFNPLTPLPGSPTNGGIVLTIAPGQTTMACQEVLLATDGGSTNVTATPPVTSVSWESLQTASISPAGFATSAFLNGGSMNVSTTPLAFEVCANPQQAPTALGSYPGAPLTIASSSLTAPFTVPVTLDVISGMAAPLFSEIGVFRAVSAGGLGIFLLDKNPNDYNYADTAVSGTPGVVDTKFFGLAGDIPVAGDWSGSGFIRIGVFRCPTAGVCSWYIDLNNNGQWDGVAGGDAIWTFGLPGDIPVVGDWNGTGVSKIGVMRCPAVGQPGTCNWYLDVNNQHTYVAGSTAIYSFGLPGDQPAIGNWATTANIGVFRCPAVGVCTWILDSLGLNAYNTGDKTYGFGLPGDKAVVGNWYNGSPQQIGVFRQSTGEWIPLTGNPGFFGLPGDQPVVGYWTAP